MFIGRNIRLFVVTIAGCVALAMSSISSAGPLADWLAGSTATQTSYFAPASYSSSGCSTCTTAPMATPSAPAVTYHAPAPIYSYKAPTVTYSPAVSTPVVAFSPTVAYQPTAVQDPMKQPWFPNLGQRRWWRRIQRQQTYSPVVASSCGTPACAPTVAYRPTQVRYIPQTSYRTVWRRVPVTNYRPVASVDPCTGCTTTVMKPCSTYTWQAQRVPTVCYRPVQTQPRTGFFQRLCNRWKQPATPTYSYSPAVACPAPCSTCPTPCTTGSCSTGACGVPMSSMVSSAPGYYSGSPSGCSSCNVPSMPGPATSLPPVVPSTSSPNSSGSGSGSMVPIPETGPPSLNQNTQLKPSTDGQQLLRLPPVDPPTQNPAKTDREKKFPVDPIPDTDTDATETDWNINRAPKLLDPRDKTAVRPMTHRWAVRQVVWPKVDPKPEEKRWDDSGWVAAPR